MRNITRKTILATVDQLAIGKTNGNSLVVTQLILYATEMDSEPIFLEHFLCENNFSWFVLLFGTFFFSPGALLTRFFVPSVT